jgi:hypothetical protein
MKVLYSVSSFAKQLQAMTFEECHDTPLTYKKIYIYIYIQSQSNVWIHLLIQGFSFILFSGSSIKSFEIMQREFVV